MTLGLKIRNIDGDTDRNQIRIQSHFKGQVYGYGVLWTSTYLLAPTHQQNMNIFLLDFSLPPFPDK